MEAAETATWNDEIELTTSRESATREKNEMIKAVRVIEGQLASSREATAMLGAKKAAMATDKEELVRRWCIGTQLLRSLVQSE